RRRTRRPSRSRGDNAMCTSSPGAVLDDVRYVRSWQAAWMDTATVNAHLERIKQNGYTIVEDAIAPDLVDALNDDLSRLERDLAVEPATTDFDGASPLRVSNLLVPAAPWQRVPVHEPWPPPVDGTLDPAGRTSSLSSP